MGRQFAYIVVVLATAFLLHRSAYLFVAMFFCARFVHTLDHFLAPLQPVWSAYVCERNHQ